MRNFWSNLREQGNEKKQKEDNSCPLGVERQLRATAQRINPKFEDADNPMIALPDQFVKPGESCDQQICPGTIPFS